MLSKIGEKIFQNIFIFGKFIVFVLNVIRSIGCFKVKIRLILQQVLYLGVHSVPIVSLTALFIGMAFSVQVVKELLRFGAPDLVGGVVAIAIWRELGPLMTGVVIAGRVGASIAAEIGSMKVTEQLDALKSLSVSPIRYLVTPRLASSVICLPILTLISDIIGILGGLIIGITSLQFSLLVYTEYTIKFLEMSDIYSGLIKSVAFGIIISLSGCYFGFTSKGGAAGVGKSTTSAVITASMLILAFNYLLTALMFQK